MPGAALQHEPPRHQNTFGTASRKTRNYTELDFRSLVNYTLDELEAMGRSPTRCSASGFCLIDQSK
jgi:hypothetical protein